MNKECLHINMVPRDLLFCRDARPMEDSWSGSGGFLPSPATLLGAVNSEFYRVYPEEQYCKIAERVSAGLQTFGPFLRTRGETFFPTPLDVIPDNKLLQLRKLAGHSDLPKPLEYALFADQPSKNKVAPYISCQELKKYLIGESGFCTVGEEDFFLREARPGITIDPDTRTAREHEYYFAEYLRLKKDVSLAGEVMLENDSGKLSKLFDHSPAMILGGQQSVVYVDKESSPTVQLPAAMICGKLVKWVLLTPAAWQSGWLPLFVEPDSGKVKLRAEMGDRPQRLPGESRAEYRKRLPRTDIDARLIAARVGKALPVSGWKLHGNGGGSPRATRLWVPAGSVYYFEAADEKNARLLAKALHGRALSEFGGRAGFGTGVCGNFIIDNNN